MHKRRPEKDRFTDSRHKAIVQFLPFPGVSTAWEFGWGFECGGFRFVMFAPENFDSPAVRGLRPRSDRKEHAPAHVHVMDIASGRESRFALIEGASADGHRCELLAQSEKVAPLSDIQVAKTVSILGDYVTDFIQLWRESYKDSPLSSFVTRSDAQEQGMAR